MELTDRQRRALIYAASPEGDGVVLARDAVMLPMVKAGWFTPAYRNKAVQGFWRITAEGRKRAAELNRGGA